MRVPAEVGFFMAGGTTPLVALGAVQIIGGLLMGIKKTRIVGARLAASGLFASSIVLLMAGKPAFALVSLLPTLLAVAIVIDTVKTTSKTGPAPAA